MVTHLNNSIDAAWDAYQQDPIGGEELLWSELTKMARGLAGERFADLGKDAAQEALVQLLGAIKAGSYHGKSKFSTWAYSVVNRRLIDEARLASKQRRREVQLEVTGLDRSPLDPGMKVEQQERTAAINKHLDTLTGNVRKVAEMRLANRSFADIAEELGITKNWAKRLWMEAKVSK